MQKFLSSSSSSSRDKEFENGHHQEQLPHPRSFVWVGKWDNSTLVDDTQQQQQHHGVEFVDGANSDVQPA